MYVRITSQRDTMNGWVCTATCPLTLPSLSVWKGFVYLLFGRTIAGRLATTAARKSRRFLLPLGQRFRLIGKRVRVVFFNLCRFGAGCSVRLICIVEIVGRLNKILCCQVGHVVRKKMWIVCSLEKNKQTMYYSSMGFYIMYNSWFRIHIKI